MIASPSTPEPEVPFEPPRRDGNELVSWSEPTLFAILVFFSVLPYCNALVNGFVYDDTTQVLDNPYILSFRYLGRIFSTTAWSYVGTHTITNYYRPMMTFGYLLCMQVLGPKAWGFHLANILLHAAVVCALYVVTRRLFKNRGIAFLAAACFALLPKHTEPVDWIAAVSDLEVTLFLLMAFLFFLRVEDEGKHTRWASLGMSLAFALAILSKEQALMFPPLVTVFEHFYRGDRARTSWVKKALRYSPFWILSLAYLLFRKYAFGAFAPLMVHADISRSQAIFSGVSLAGQYVMESFRFFHLSAFYSFRPVSTIGDPAFLWSVAALAGCAVIFVLLWWRDRVASFGFVWFFAMLAPVLNVRMLASDNVFAERYLYLPSVGFCWLAGYALMKVWDRTSSRQRIWRWALAGGLSVIAVSFVAQIVSRNRVWRSEMVLDSATLLDAPDATPIYNNLAALYWNQGDVDQAERMWRQALTIAPQSSVIYNNLGLVALKRQNTALAIACFKKSIELQSILPDAHLNLGYVYQETGERAQAEAEYKEAMRLAPLNVHIRNRLGDLYRQEGRTDEALQQFTLSASIAPNVVAFDALGELFQSRNMTAKAEEMFQQALSLNSADVGARRKLAGLYTASGRTAQAREQYEMILKSNPDDAEARAALQRLAASNQHDQSH